jgi:hypothetical protein
MIRHPAVREHRHRQAQQRLKDELKESRVIGELVKHFRAGIASLENATRETRFAVSAVRGTDTLASRMAAHFARQPVCPGRPSCGKE